MYAIRSYYALLVSIVAGKPVAAFEAAFGAEAAVLRVMPNTPAAVGRGISGLYANRNNFV